MAEITSSDFAKLVEAQKEYDLYQNAANFDPSSI